MLHRTLAIEADFDIACNDHLEALTRSMGYKRIGSVALALELEGLWHSFSCYGANSIAQFWRLGLGVRRGRLSGWLLQNSSLNL